MKKFSNYLPSIIVAVVIVPLSFYLYSASFAEKWFTGATVYPLETEICWDEANNIFRSTTLRATTASLVISINGSYAQQFFDCEVDNIVSPKVYTSVQSEQQHSGKYLKEGIKIMSLNIPSNSKRATVFIGNVGRTNLKIKVDNNKGLLPKIISLSYMD